MTSTADEVWFREGFDEHRRALHAHCYRLAGNVADADDLVQETFLRAWRSRTQYEGRASIRTRLYRIATNIYLDHRKAAARRTVPAGDSLEWCTDIGPYPDSLLGEDPQSDLVARETVELALIAALMYCRHGNGRRSSSVTSPAGHRPRSPMLSTSRYPR